MLFRIYNGWVFLKELFKRTISGEMLYSINIVFENDKTTIRNCEHFVNPWPPPGDGSVDSPDTVESQANPVSRPPVVLARAAVCAYNSGGKAIVSISL